MSPLGAPYRNYCGVARQLNWTFVAGAFPELAASTSSVLLGGIVRVWAPLLHVVLEPEMSHLRLCDGSERKNSANVRVATLPGAASTRTLKSLATIVTLGESWSLPVFWVEPNEPEPETGRLTSQLVQLGNSFQLPARNHVAPPEVADELPLIRFITIIAEPERAKTNATVAVTLA
jgi:hypothetical protein